MKFDVSFLQPKLEQMPAYAAAAEALGFAGFWVAETNSDPFSTWPWPPSTASA